MANEETVGPKEDRFGLKSGERSMKAVVGLQPRLEYMDSFRYPLAGE